MVFLIKNSFPPPFVDRIVYQNKLYLTDQYFFVKVIKQSIFHEGVVRVIQRRDLSTDSVMTRRYQASQPGKY